MPREKLVPDPTNYRGYKLKSKYRYNQKQLDIIIDALEYYYHLYDDKSDIRNLNSDYMVFDVTICFNEPATINDDVFSCDDGGFLEFNYNDLTKLLDRKYFYYRYSKEFSPKYGSHCHLMVIGNHVSKSFLERLRLDIANLDGIKSAYISPRKFHDDLLISHRRTKRKHFHYLKERNPDHKDGLRDCVERMSYRAKVDQKPKYKRKNYRSFDGTRDLKPLLPRYNKTVARCKQAKNNDVFDLFA